MLGRPAKPCVRGLNPRRTRECEVDLGRKQLKEVPVTVVPGT